MFIMHVSNGIIKIVWRMVKKLCNLNSRIKMKKINLDMHEVTEDSALCDPSRSPALHRSPQDFQQLIPLLI